jgi:hypothetical protein
MKCKKCGRKIRGEEYLEVIQRYKPVEFLCVDCTRGKYIVEKGSKTDDYFCSRNIARKYIVKHINKAYKKEEEY